MEPEESCPNLAEPCGNKGQNGTGGTPCGRFLHLLGAPGCILEQAPVGVLVTDLDGKIEYVNQTMLLQMGHGRQTLIGKVLPKLLDDETCPRLMEVVEYASRGESTAETVHCTLVDCDGGPIRLELVVKRGVCAGGEGKLIFSSFDVSGRTDLKRVDHDLERRRHRTHLFESLSTFAGGLAHNMNNLLTIVLGNIELASNRLEKQTEVGRHLAAIRKAALKACSLTNRILAFSHIGAMGQEKFDFARLVQGAVRDCRSGFPDTTTVRCQTARGKMQVEGDPHQLKQAVIGILENAREAIGEEYGTIGVFLDLVDCSRDFLASTFVDDGLSGGRYVRLAIIDNGPGMKAETFLRAFEPFYTTKLTGRGLGLPVLLGTVRNNGGAVVLQSTVEGGTSVEIFLPAKP